MFLGLRCLTEIFICCLNIENTHVSGLTWKVWPAGEVDNVEKNGRGGLIGGVVAGFAGIFLAILAFIFFVYKCLVVKEGAIHERAPPSRDQRVDILSQT